MPNSPLFVRTDSDLSDSSSDDFDERLCRASDDFDFDKDNDTIKDFEQGEVDGQPLSHVNSDIVISDGTETVNFNFSSKSPEPYSSDPFAINYRKTADWDEATKAKFQKEYWFIPDVLEKYQSVEHAEFTRPFDQFRVLLQERGLFNEYSRLFATPDEATRSCLVMNMLLENAPELILRYQAIVKLMRERMALTERGEKPEWEQAWEKRTAAESRGDTRRSSMWHSSPHSSPV